MIFLNKVIGTVYKITCGIVDLIYIVIMNLRLSVKNSFKFPLVTIVVPLFNEERFIIDCLKSIKQQSYKNWECFIVNDCSTDNSVNIAEKFIRGAPGFRIIHHDRNRGLAASRNTGLQNANGEFITFLDSDDFLFKSSIWQRVNALVEGNRTNVAGSFSGITVCNENTRLNSFVLGKYLANKAAVVDFISAKGECPFNAHAPLLKVSVVRSFSGFNEAMLHGAEDWDLWYRILRHGYIFVHSYGCGAVYRQKHKSMVRRLPTFHVAEAKKLINNAFNYMKDEPEISDCPFVFRESIYYYEKLLIEAKRYIGYAMMAYLGDDEKGADEIIALLDPSVMYLMESHIPVNKIMDASITRFFCLSNSNIDRYSHHKEVFYNKMVERLKTSNIAA